LVRRTRRDLSDKKVRKIIRKKQKDSPHQRGSVRVSGSKRSLFKPLIYVILSIALVFILFRIIQLVDFENLLPEGSDSEQSNTVVSSPENQNQQKSEKKKPVQEKVLQPVPQLLQVEVLNGCGVSGLANTTTNFLRTEKIDVVYKGNYKNFNVEKTQIIDRAGNLDQAMEIAKVLGIEKSLVSSDIDKNKQLAATIILGKDYKKLNPFVKD